MGGDDPMAASITVFRITNGFLVTPSEHGVQASQAIYCKTSEEIGNAVITKFAKQAVAADDPQRDMFSDMTTFSDLTKPVTT